MKKITGIILLLFMFVYGCVQEPTPTKAPKPTATPGAALYRVFKDTGLYAAVDVDAALIEALPVGTLLKPANDKKYYDCESFVDAGTTYKLCHVEVVSTGKTGWVLQKWLETYKP